MPDDQTTPTLLIVNPDAGSLDGGSPEDDETLQQVKEELERHGPVTIVPGDELNEALEGADSAIRVAIAGGDGTIHHAAQGLRTHAGTVVLVPAGTGNDFAGGLGLPEDPVEAVREALAGAPTPLDLMTAGDLVAVNAAHIGIGSWAAEDAAGLKERLGSLAYPAGAVSAAKDFDPIRVTIVLDGQQVLVDEPVAAVAVCNGTTVGGGTQICPVADPADGQLDVVVSLATTLPALVATAPALMRGHHLDRDDMLHRQGRSVTVTVHGTNHSDWDVDGELLDLGRDVTWTIQPGGWRVWLPTDSQG